VFKVNEYAHYKHYVFLRETGIGQIRRVLWKDFEKVELMRSALKKAALVVATVFAHPQSKEGKRGTIDRAEQDSDKRETETSAVWNGSQPNSSFSSKIDERTFAYFSAKTFSFGQNNSVTFLGEKLFSSHVS